MQISCIAPERQSGSARIERADGDVVSVWVPDRELFGPSVGIYMWLFFQPADEGACILQSYVKIVDPKKQEESVAGLGVVGTCQRGMPVRAPLMETEQDRSIRINDLPEIVVGRRCNGLTEQRLVPFQAT